MHGIQKVQLSHGDSREDLQTNLGNLKKHGE